jgi:hypothetical protein
VGITNRRALHPEEVPAAFRGLLGHLEPIHVRLARFDDALARVGAEARVDHDRTLDVVRDTIHDVSQVIAAGNLAVYGELARIFARALTALGADPRPPRSTRSQTRSAPA